MEKMPSSIRASKAYFLFKSAYSYPLYTYTIQQKQCMHTCTIQQKQHSLQRNVKLPADQRASQISLKLRLLFLK